ncbi:MAG: hypothetical protein ACI9SP_000734 [Arenicella sp.]|jgi:hypothetical protein
MSAGQKKPDPAEITFTVKGVSAEARALFNDICSFRNTACLHDPIAKGEILTDLLMAAAKAEFSENGYRARVDDYHDLQTALSIAQAEGSEIPDSFGLD